ncbi:MAG: hypothetical protein NC432_03895 [Roseburia sp.]|nr:hypothetical protein [Roseburia sp.]MCM1098489.1 hypothetical protein [Ruminococcus flavefaciens]
MITILNFDLFGYDRMLYTIRNGCEEEESLEYPDGLQFIYFYTEGKKGGREELATLLRYFRQSTEENAVDDVTRELHGYVSRVKAKPEVRDKFMDFEEYIWYLKKDFRKEMEEEVRKEMTERIERETAERVERETAERTARENTVENILELLEEYGEIPDLLQQELAKTEDIGLLKRYHKLAAKADSIREFMSRKETLDRSLA